MGKPTSRSHAADRSTVSHWRVRSGVRTYASTGQPWAIVIFSRPWLESGPAAGFCSAAGFTALHHRHQPDASSIFLPLTRFLPWTGVTNLHTALQNRYIAAHKGPGYG